MKLFGGDCDIRFTQGAIMRKVIKCFLNIKNEQDWLTRQTGWKLVKTNGIFYTFEESNCEYNYEYIYFDKSKRELDDIIKNITDSNIEYICNSSLWALFRKDVKKGSIQVYSDNYIKFKVLMKKHSTYIALGACYLCLGSSQSALASVSNNLFGMSSVLFYFCAFIFFTYAYYLKKYASEYDDGSYTDKIKKDKYK